MTPPDDTALDGDDGLVRALPDTLASKIAAGEVVQRPANALKELIENALDAGAGQVEVVLKRAGSDLIQVSDDGCGLGPRDAAAAFGRHATSKLRQFEDLERLRTLGFRGEALASIASVAQVELKTKRRQDAAATCVRVDGGDLVEQAPCAAAGGTCVSVRNLFYNVPARRAFLKSPATEFKHLVETFQALALSHPAVGFSLVHDGTGVYQLVAAAGSREEALARRLGDLLGTDLDGALVPVEETTSYLTVRGVVGRPALARRSRGDQYLFVNGRYVRSRSLDHAVATALGALLPEGHHPLFALFLDVDPRHIDVNVHPTKTEVKFDDEKGVYSFVRAVVKKGLAEGGLGVSFEGAVPVASPRAASGLDLAPAPTSASAPEPFAPPSWPPSGLPVAVGRPSAPSGDGGGGIRGEGAAGFSFTRPDPPPAPVVPPTSRGPIPARLTGDASLSAQETLDGEGLGSDRAIWQLHDRYLLTPVRSGLLVIDQQRAHERILYEQSMAVMEGGMAPSQQLLFPFTVVLPAADRALLAEILPDLRALGFEIEIPKADEAGILVRGLPAEVRVGDERDVLERLFAQYRRNADLLRLDARENLARSLARRTSIKPGRSLRPEEARSLVDQLFACADPFTDPSGQPVVIRLPTDEIERRFLRAP